MRPSFWLTVGILISGVLGSIPFFSGLSAQRQFTAFQSEFQPGEITLADSDFQRGWLDSQAQTRFELAGGSLTFQHRFQHGLPPIFSPVWHTTLSAAEGLPQLPVRVETYISLLGSNTALLNMPEYAWQNQSFHLRSGGARGRIKFKPGQFKGELSGPLWEITTPGERLALADTALEFGGQQENDILQLRVEAGLDQLNYDPAYLPAALSLFQPRLSLGLYQQAALLSSQIKAEARPSGGGEARLALHVQRLDTQALAALLHSLSKPLDTPQAQAARSAELMQAAGALLAARPDIRLDPLHFDTPDGALTGRLHLSYPAENAPANLMLALPYLEAEGEIQMPRQVLEKIAEWQLRRHFFQQQEIPSPNIGELAQTTVAHWLETWQAYLSEEQGVYRLAFVLRQGKLTLNGQEIPLQDFF